MWYDKNFYTPFLEHLKHFYSYSLLKITEITFYDAQKTYFGRINKSWGGEEDAMVIYL